MSEPVTPPKSISAKLHAIYSVNKFLVTEPCPTTSVKVQERKGFAGIEQRVTLTPLRLLAQPRSDKLPDWVTVGDIVWVKGDFCATVFAKEVLEMDGVHFILVPDDRIVGISDINDVLET
jgi:hypothetical protein